MTEAAKPYCMLPWFHVTSHTDGRSTPCCTWKGLYHNSRIGEFFSGPEMSDLRRRMLDNDPPQGCTDCMHHSRLGTFSPRDDGWSIYRDLLGHESVDLEPKLEFIELNYSNICNLKCRMCGNDRSSKWAADAEAMGFHVHGKIVNDVSISDEMLSTLRFVRILGGEPLLHEEQMIDMLSRVHGMGRLGEFSVGITTNGMIKPGDRLLDLLSGCRNVFWTVSIDAFGDLNDYIRTGSSWPVISQHLDLMSGMTASRPHWCLNIGTVCMLLNANRMHELPIWLDERYPGIDINHYWYPLNFPEYLAINRLPGDYLNGLADMYDGMDAGGPSRRDRWWKPLASHFRQAAGAGQYMQRHDSYSVYQGPSMELISRLDGLRSESLEITNRDVWLQLSRT